MKIIRFTIPLWAVALLLPAQIKAQESSDLLTRICFEGCENTSSYLSYIYYSKLPDKGQFPAKDQSVSSFALDLNLFESNFGLLISNYLANNSGLVRKELLHIAPFYRNKLFNGQRYQWNYKIIGKLRNFYRNENDSPDDLYEFQLMTYMPQLIGNGFGLTMNYRYTTPAHGGPEYLTRGISGWYYKTGIDYKMKLPALIGETPTRLKLFWDISYRDNLGGKHYDSDWTHTTFGIKAGFNLSENITFNPTLCFQKTMDRMIEPDDTLYFYGAFTYKF